MTKCVAMAVIRKSGSSRRSHDTVWRITGSSGSRSQSSICGTGGEFGAAPSPAIGGAAAPLPPVLPELVSSFGASSPQLPVVPPVGPARRHAEQANFSCAGQRCGSTLLEVSTLHYEALRQRASDCLL